jgi:hypothetical protein
MSKTRKNSAVYDSSDYNSNDGMLTSVWGPALWHYLHTMSFNYPVTPLAQDKKKYREFVLNLQYVLPCGKCRKNLKKNLASHPLIMTHMESRSTFSKYIFDLHEIINKMLNKTSGLTYDKVRERYEHFRARCATEKNIAPPASIKAGANTRRRKKKDEKGCVVPLYGKKARCLIQIVPFENKTKTLQIDERCLKKKIIISDEKRNMLS